MLQAKLACREANAPSEVGLHEANAPSGDGLPRG